MKNALVVTTQYVNNYGAVLQAYGMHCLLEKQGWKHEFLKQSTPDAYVFENVFPIRRSSVYKALSNFRKIPFFMQYKTKFKNFDVFRQKFFPQTELYASQEDVIAAELDYDLYITGGDQLFNRSCLNRPVNLLKFGNAESDRISYSTSMGSASFSKKEKEGLVADLSKYKELSFREVAACDYLKNDLQVPLRTDIDGSFLIDMHEWDKVAVFDARRYPPKYILVYELIHHSDLNKTIRAVKAKFNLPVVVITALAKSACDADIFVRDAGPSEFVGLFSHADYVVTTSFHGTCFSVIYEKPFISLIRRDETRINSLLSDFDLSNRCFTEFENIPDKVCFDTAKRIILKRKTEAVEYLKRYFG